ncbi:MAG: hypothetical protein K5841_03670 [Fretibacterium sp.]|nr:hypothetical protein [Fretibacterium sp.]
MNKWDKRVFQKILKYCGQVAGTHKFFHLPAGRLTRQPGFVSLVIAGTLAALFYYGAVFLLLEGINAMPPTPPQAQAPAHD